MIFHLVLNLTMGRSTRSLVLHTSAAWQPSVILREEQMLRKKSVDVNIV